MKRGIGWGPSSTGFLAGYSSIIKTDFTVFGRYGYYKLFSGVYEHLLNDSRRSYFLRPPLFI